MRFYLVVNLDKPNAADCAAQAAAKLLHYGAEVLLTPELNRVLNLTGVQILSETEAMRNSDAAISIGGDGTMIHTALAALEFDRPVIGINSGRLGYLTQIEPPFGESLRKLANGEFVIQPRTVLAVTVHLPELRTQRCGHCQADGRQHDRHRSIPKQHSLCLLSGRWAYFCHPHGLHGLFYVCWWSYCRSGNGLPDRHTHLSPFSGRPQCGAWPGCSAGGASHYPEHTARCRGCSGWNHHLPHGGGDQAGDFGG